MDDKASPRSPTSHLSCFLCDNVYKTPRYLQCLHYFCHGCLDDYIKNQDTKKLFERGIPCPVCEQLTPVPYTQVSASDLALQLPVNTLVGGTMDDENTFCDVCKAEDKSISAKSYCVTCQDCLCEECTSYHKKFKTTKSHQIITSSENIGKQYQSLITETESCPTHVRHPITFYCQDHNALCCNNCVIMRHRKCDIVIELEESTYKTQNITDTEDLKSRMGNCKNRYDEIINVAEDNLKYLKHQETLVPQKVSAAETKVLEYFADAKDRIDSQSKQFFTEERDRNATQSKRCKKMMAAIDSSCDMFERALDIGSQRQIFIMRKRMEDQCKQYENTVKDELDRLRRIELQLDIDRVVDGLLLEQKVESRITLVKRPLLRLTLNNSPDRCYSRCMMVETIKENPKTPRYTGASFLPSGNLVLIDQTNSKCVVFDPHYHFLIQQSLPASPFKVAVIGSDEVAVTLRKDTKILILKIKTRIKLIREIPTPRPCWCLLPVDDNRLAVVWDGEDNPSFGIIDHQGNELTHFSQTKDGRQIKNFRHLGIDTVNGRVIQPCCIDNALYCFKFDGTPDFVYRHDDLLQPAGVSVDRDGGIYICSYDTHCIHRLTPEGQLFRIIRTQNMLKPLVPCFNQGEEFIVTVDNPGGKQTLHVFRPNAAITADCT